MRLSQTRAATLYRHIERCRAITNTRSINTTALTSTERAHSTRRNVSSRYRLRFACVCQRIEHLQRMLHGTVDSALEAEVALPRRRSWSVP